ncbi:MULTISPECIES: hypothetical protein [Paraburkholderia]|uniref:hypothetical protein n=1 Tax=Paraburkholderia TaxID=1822464 RepID=UPI002257B7F0|nr:MULTISPECIES: hypothetical protein [Paraburkholderia]MCX4169990.1 hypothetical protein [Paraburkholderia madseniana]MDQ6458002.1 hypothetical protein [Paraburkholderia madseniana]
MLFDSDSLVVELEAVPSVPLDIETGLRGERPSTSRIADNSAGMPGRSGAAIPCWRRPAILGDSDHALLKLCLDRVGWSLTVSMTVLRRSRIRMPSFRNV